MTDPTLIDQPYAPDPEPMPRLAVWLYWVSLLILSLVLVWQVLNGVTMLNWGGR